ncbi:MAG: TPR end-of-group domain-containing protein [Solirubrobacteraceae bacterium]
MLVESLAEHEHPALHYHLACAEALCGNRERALEELHVAVTAEPRYADNALRDEDFDSIRDDPRFPR